MPSPWVVHHSQSVYQNPQASGGNVEVNWHTSSDIHRRHAPDDILQQIAHRAGPLHPVPSREYRVYNQQQEVSARSNPRNRISWDDNQLGEDGHQSSRRKDQEYQTGGTEIAQSSQTLSSPPLSINWQAQCYHPSTSDGSSFLLLSSEMSTLEANSQNYQSPVQLSPQAVEDLQWWVLHLSTWNGRSLITQQASLTITTDASLQGWGATCNGIQTRGPWSPQEQTLHINCLELLAATLAVQSFAKEKSGTTILLKIDNTSAVAYINRMGGTASPTLSRLTKDLWLWCMERNILLQAQHLPGVLNSIADRESSIWSDRSEWKLSPAFFQRINHWLGPLSTDLFASRLSAQLPAFISWKPDPLAIATDAFTVDWSNIPAKPYANPPWNLVDRVLSQILNQEVQELVLVAPVWKPQSWYSLLLQMLVREPLLIPQSPETIQSVCHNNLPDISPQLAMWVVSGIDARVATFQNQLRTSFCHHGGLGGLTGVRNGIEISFLDLSAM